MAGATSEGATYEGTVKSYNPEKGWGHIECAETFEHYGKDVFMLKSQFRNASAVNKGQRVTFGLTDNGRGPEAMDIQVSNSTGGFSGGMMSTPGAGQFVGTIKSFNPTSGWGHITCPQTEQIYGKDIFFMKSNLPGGAIAKGATVSFTVVQGLKGPEANKIEPMGGCGGGMQQQPQFGGMVPNPIMPVAGQQWNGGGAMQAPGGSSPIYYGTIKSFNEEKGWGHISCQQTQAMYGRDMFVLRSSLNGAAITAGDTVQFIVGQGQKGIEAQQVRVMGTAATSGQVYMGTMKNWNQEKGWGFISCNDTHQLYGKDIFLHKNVTGAHTPSAGETVQFSVQISDQGRPEAGSVSFVGSGYGPYKAAPQVAAARTGPWSWSS